MQTIRFNAFAANRFAAADKTARGLQATLALQPVKAAKAHAAPAAGPGWFESSFDLAQGLDVSEGMPADQSLEEWLAIGMLLA